MADWARIEAQTRGVLELVAEAIRAFLDWVRGRFAGTVRQGIIDPSTIYAGQPVWAVGVAQVIARGVAPVLGQSYLDQWPEDEVGDWASSTRVREYLADRENKLRGVPDQLFAKVRGTIEQGVGNGAGIPELAAVIEAQLLDAGAPYWMGRAETIARTETLGAWANGEYLAMVDYAMTTRQTFDKIWIASHDDRTRPDHREADGQRVALEGVFYVGGWPAIIPHDPALPPEQVINCITGDTPVSAGDFRRAYRRDYRGPLVIIELETGARLSASPNHPVLTPRGWVGAGEVDQGDYLIGAAFGDLAAGRPDVQGQPATAAQLYDALALAGHTHRLGGSAVDFHGDGNGSYVDVVTADRPLILGLQPTGSQEGPQGGLTLADDADPAGGSTLQSGFRGRSAPGGVVGSRDLPPSGIGRHALPFERFGRAAAPDLGPALNEDASNGGTAHPEVLADRLLTHAACVPFEDIARGDRHPPPPSGLANSAKGHASGDQAVTDGGGCASVQLGEFSDGGSGQIPTLKVVDVNVVQQWHGHLYNFETADGVYVAADIVNHNCRCTVLYPTRGETVDLSNRGMRG